MTTPVTSAAVNILSRLQVHPAGKVAIVDAAGSHTYGALRSSALALSTHLRGLRSPDDAPPRVAILAPRDRTWMHGMIASWYAGATAVPLAESYPPAELRYVLQSVNTSAVIAPRSGALADAVAGVARELNIPFIVNEDATNSKHLNTTANPSSTHANFDAHVTHALQSIPKTGSEMAETAAVTFSAPKDGAYIIFTSGTTGRPKGVLTRHSGLAAQIQALESAWGWTSSDRILSVLPLHHVHGVMGIALSAMWAGATLEMLPKFDAAAVFSALRRPAGSANACTLFFAVPTVYAKLIELFDRQSPEIQAIWATALRAAATPDYSPDRVALAEGVTREKEYADIEFFRQHAETVKNGGIKRRNSNANLSVRANGNGTAPNALVTETYQTASSTSSQTTDSSPSQVNGMRLMVSGSAALPTSVMRRWRDISGHTLLERYGMTEFGLAISNPLDGAPRVPGRVGRPIGTFEARIVDEVDGTTPVRDGLTGELQLRGPGVFDIYWGRPDATAESFTADGWFRTGDVAVVAPPTHEWTDTSPAPPPGSIAIAGRLSADIIKSGGYKLSALDIERELLEHADIAEVAVLGIPDTTYGERVAAVIVRKNGTLTADGLDLKQWASTRMAPYKVPSILRIVAEIPRNAMGKVNKKSLRTQLFADSAEAHAGSSKASN